MGNSMRTRIFFLLTLLVGVGIHTTLYAGLTYREKYAGVLSHYAGESDSLKYMAALFLIDNMDGHVSPEGAAMENYKRRIRAMGRAKDIRQLQAAWYASLKDGGVKLVPDSAVVTDEYLIDNIDRAFTAWQSAPWAGEITFRQFCDYILPYRVNDEHIGAGWRGPLLERYGKVAEGVTDLSRAFALVRDTVFNTMVLSNAYCEYNLDPMTCTVAGRAECGQRCILLVAVLRALGIPATIDGTPMWADYSSKGHAWVATVGAQGDTYTVFEQDSIARQLNPIDASLFLPRYDIRPEDGCPYAVKTSKTPVKAYRINYRHSNAVERDAPSLLASPFIEDVSARYGLTTDVSMETAGDGMVYLCCYLSGVDWIPVAKAMPEGGRVTFHNVGRGSVCVPVTLVEGRRVFLSCPFLVGDKGIERSFVPVPDTVCEIRIDRKYPLCSYTTDTWGYMRGGTFEGAMAEDFSDADTLAAIETMPHGMTRLAVSAQRKYRYLRYHSPKGSRSSLAELQFYTADGSGKERLLTGSHIARGVDMPNVGNVFDGSLSTICRGLATGYHIGLDLGEGNASMVTGIAFCPSTDLNFVEKGHLYELYYFDTEWHLIERQIAQKGELTFKNVPSNALLLLKDKTAGIEERIFEYKNGEQIWH